MASVLRKGQAAAQADTEPANAGAGDPAWANYAGTRKTQDDKLQDLLETPIPDDVDQRRQMYRQNGLIRG
eukprot:13024377-Alexandrium_andersonii.AAC.1